MRRRLLILALVLAACGGNGPADTTIDTTDSTTPATSPVEATTTTAASEPTGVRFVAGDGTEARFVVWEVLFGNDTEVVAVNTDVTVDVTVDFDEPGRSVIGPVRVAADGFVTDQSRRDGAINQFILESGNHPEIVFNPVDLGRVGSALAGGSTVIRGDLVIKATSVPVTFDVTVESATPEGIVAHAAAEVNRTDWGLSIPNVAQVASVDEQVRLELDLVLVPAG